VWCKACFGILINILWSIIIGFAVRIELYNCVSPLLLRLAVCRLAVHLANDCILFAQAFHQRRQCCSCLHDAVSSCHCVALRGCSAYTRGTGLSHVSCHQNSSHILTIRDRIGSEEICYVLVYRPRSHQLSILSHGDSVVFSCDHIMHAWELGHDASPLSALLFWKLQSSV